MKRLTSVAASRMMGTMSPKARYQKGEAGSDLILVAALVIGLGIAWMLSGGPQKSTLGDAPPFGIQRITSGESFPGISTFFIPITGGSGYSTSGDGTAEFEQLQKEIGQTRNLGEVSPYWGEVRIVRDTSGPRESSNREYVELETAYNATSPITITGWRLQSMLSHTTATIGVASKIATSGNGNVEGPVIALPEDRLIVLSGHSPIGASFQLNMCSGYLEQFQDFSPSISRRCPLPEEELELVDSDTLRFGSACLNYIESLPGCEMPLEALPEGFPSACVLFITEKINYNSCIKNHHTDPEFLLHEWRVFLKSDGELWNNDREIIRLLDENGKTVDVFSY